ncbi:unnamed protein product [Effrenium voratum]|nr:unnamed protein product [Effrenium voratum]
MACIHVICIRSLTALANKWAFSRLGPGPWECWPIWDRRARLQGEERRIPHRKQITMAMRGALQFSRLRMMKIEVPEFSKSRFARRSNLMDEDRVKWYNWNLACIALTTIPLTWMYTVNYRTSEEVEMIYRTLDPMGALNIKYDLKLYGS